MKKRKPYKFIYNPHAGQKRNPIGIGGVSLEDIRNMLTQYEIDADYAPTKYAGHAKILAAEAVKEGYHTVIVAGGDGSVSEAANGLVGSDVKLGILPMGTFMNIALMLSISTDIEKAIQLIKIGRTRKIDMGALTHIDGEKLDTRFNYIETAGIGLDAEIQEEFKKFEKGSISSILRIFHIIGRFYASEVAIKTDDDTIVTRSSLISVANGPYTGANLRLAPRAKLNDHKLTITIYRMSKYELLKYFFNMKVRNKVDARRLRTIQTTTATITSIKPVAIHADATLFGQTPAKIEIVPGAINAICGFPKKDEPQSLKSRTMLSP